MRTKASGDDGAEQIAGDHDAAAVEAVEEDAGDGAGEDGGDGAGEEDAGDDHAGAGLLHDEGEDGDIVEVVANFADDLAHPGVAVVAIVPQQARQAGHGLPMIARGSRRTAAGRSALGLRREDKRREEKKGPSCARIDRLIWDPM